MQKICKHLLKKKININIKNYLFFKKIIIIYLFIFLQVDKWKV